MPLEHVLTCAEVPEEIVKARKAWVFGASPVITDGVVYAADLNGRVYAFPLERPAPQTSG